MAQGNVPKRGDLVWISFDPQAGYEQAGHRPALVLSPEQYNDKTNYVIVCPITSTIKGYPFEVILPDGLGVSGAVLSDQVKSLDRNARHIRIVDSAPDSVVIDVQAKLNTLLD